MEKEFERKREEILCGQIWWTENSFDAVSLLSLTAHQAAHDVMHVTLWLFSVADGVDDDDDDDDDDWWLIMTVLL